MKLIRFSRGGARPRFGGFCLTKDMDKGNQLGSCMVTAGEVGNPYALQFVDQKDFPVAALNESGLGDITTSLFFSPKSPTAGGWIWGAGPVLLLPTATQDALGTDKWGLGPTGVVLK